MRFYKQPDPNVDKEFQSVDQRLTFLENVRSVPIGGAILWTGETIPENFLLCDGQSYAVNRYPRLYRVLGRRGGTPSPDNEDSFKVPDLSVGSFNFIIRAQ